MSAYLFLLQLLGLWTGLIALLVATFAKPLRARTPGWIRSGLLFLQSLALFLVLAEAGAWLLFPPASDGIGYTPSGRAWHARYWGPVNSFGFRDAEPDLEHLGERKLALVIGDSYTAAQGIENRRDRFSAYVGRCLGEDWVVMTVAISGWDTAEQLAFLRDFKHRPDLVVWSYCPNDIEACWARVTHGDRWWSREIIGPVPTFLLVRSHFFSRLLARTYLPMLYPKFVEKLNESYENPEVWACHEAELNEMAGYIHNANAKSLMVYWTYLGLDGPLARIRDIIAANDIPILESNTLVPGIPFTDLIVSEQDTHPNELYHQRVGEAICAWLEEQGLTPATQATS